MSIISLKNVSFAYETDGGRVQALSDVSLDIGEGEFICILGHNGSGKSTLAKLMNALLLPESGSVTVNGMDTKEEEDLWKIRKHAGMVFQNPDNQIVSSIVEEDIAFGPENLGMPREEMVTCIRRAIKAVGMEGHEQDSPAMLSGGQKQRIAIAGVLAMLPDVIICDEPTAMLDPKGRAEVLETIHRLNKRLGKTIVLITHYMEETVDADRIVVLQGGRITASGTPREVFAMRSVIESAGLSMPIAGQLYFDLKDSGVELAEFPVTKEELVEGLCSLP